MSTERTLISIELETAQRWSIGAPANVASAAPAGPGRSQIDLPVQRVGTGDSPYLPGTSVAGSLKAHLGPELGPKWLGADPSEFERPGAKPEASLLAVVSVDVMAGGAIQDRGQTAIDPIRAAAQDNTLRWSEHSAPATVRVVLQHQGAVDAELLRRCQDWRPFLGRGRSVGMGAFRVRQVRSAQCDLDDAAGLGWWLTDRHTWPQTPEPTGVLASRWDARPDELAGRNDVGASTVGQPSIEFRVVEPIHLGSGHPVGPQQPLPILKGADETPFVPGSSWKGLFRHRIQVILRAVEASPSQMQAVTAWVFGGRDRRSRVRFEDSPMTGAVEVAPHHIAIDRFTGGARTSALYRLAAASRDTTLKLAWSWLEDPDPAARAAVENLFHHVCRDLDDGLVHVGGAGARGYGRVRAQTPIATTPVSLEDLMSALSLNEEAEPS